jgi:hypothetical protein
VVDWAGDLLRSHSRPGSDHELVVADSPIIYELDLYAVDRRRRPGVEGDMTFAQRFLTPEGKILQLAATMAEVLTDD